MSIERSREFIKDALSEYAGFYRALASGNNQKASGHLQGIQSIDSHAKLKLVGDELQYYRQRKSQLMRLFRTRLVTAMEGQLEDNLIAQVEKIVVDLESAS